MDADRLTTKSQEAVSAAVRRAAAEGHPEVAPVHLLLALLDQPEGIAKPLLQAVGADPAGVRSRAEALLQRLLVGAAPGEQAEGQQDAGREAEQHNGTFRGGLSLSQKRT